MPLEREPILHRAKTRWFACKLAKCGDGFVDGVVGGQHEVCDDGNTTTETACPYGEGTCTFCKGDCSTVLNLTGPFCGDLHKDSTFGEMCDDATRGDTTCPYATTCTVCNNDCLGTTSLVGPSCGDGVVQTDDNEECDGNTHLNGGTCANQGFTTGTLKCTAGCQFDTALCSKCGDNIVEPGETCEPPNTPICSATCQAILPPPPTPTVVSTVPADGAVGVAAGANVVITFNTAMTPATLTIQAASGACSATASILISLDSFVNCIGAPAPMMSGLNTIATINPAAPLPAGTYQIKVTTDAENTASVGLAADFVTPTGFTTP